MYATVTYKFPHRVPEDLIEQIRRQIPISRLFRSDRQVSFDTPVGTAFRSFMDYEIHKLTTERNAYSITVEMY